ncbi:MAG: hypothetical protein JWN82_265 [Candidatus Saccharibacteria bacterium]|nr:hypothetical protein [Candidatus Saccharibacteria bacterium]
MIGGESLTEPPLPRLWYESEFEAAQLESGDMSWLSALAGRAITDDDIVQANRYVASGSINLNYDHDPQTVQGVTKARDSFFEAIGILDATSPVSDSFEQFRQRTRLAVPLSTFISAQRTYAELGVDSVTAAQRRPYIFGTSAAKIKQVVVALEARGLDAARAINADPAFVGYGSSTIAKKLSLLQEVRLPMKTIYSTPQVMRISRAKVDALDTLGLNVERVLRKQPGLMSLSSKTLVARFDNLVGLGLDATKVTNALPTALCLDPEGIDRRLNSINERGLPAVKVINTVPALLGLGSETISTKCDYLDSLGVTSTVAVTKMPGILCLSETTVRQRLRTIQLLLHTLGSSQGAAELVTFHPALLASSTSKITAIGRFLAEHGEKSPEDDTPRYIRRLIMQPLAHYLLVVADGHALDARSLERSRHHTPKESRRQAVLEAITDPAQRQLVGKKCLAAYLAYDSSTLEE